MFGETVTSKRLLGMIDDPAERLALLAATIDDSIATVFRQVAMNRFEHAVHTARRDEGELAVERFNELWADIADGDARRRRSRSPRATARGGATSPTSSRRPATCTPTPTASCSRSSVYRRYELGGDDFVPQYLELLRVGRFADAGGARRDRRLRPVRPGVLGRRPGDRRRAAAGRGGRRGGRRTGVIRHADGVHVRVTISVGQPGGVAVPMTSRGDFTGVGVRRWSRARVLVRFRSPSSRAPTGVSAADLTPWVYPVRPALCTAAQAASGHVAGCLLDGPDGQPEARGWATPPFPDATGAVAVHVGGRRCDGEIVSRIQAALVQHGIPTVVDGGFGAATKAAVVTFQQQDGLGATGVVDTATASARSASTASVAVSPSPGPRSLAARPARRCAVCRSR